MGEFRKFRLSVMAAMCLAALGSAPALVHATDAEVLQRLDALQKEIDSLRAQLNEATKKVETVGETSKKADDKLMSTIERHAKETAPPTTKRGGTYAYSETTGITIYGKVELIEEATNDGAVTRHALGSNSSRFGFKAARKLSDTLSGIMQVETGWSPDDSANSKALANRNSYIGLSDQHFGAFIMGTHDMPSKMLEGFSQPMFGSGDEMEIIIHGKGTRVAANTTASPWNNFHTRQTNVFQYWSPKFENFQVRLAYSADEQQTVTSYQKPVSGGSLEYFDGHYQAGIAYERQANYTAQDHDMTSIKATLGAKFGDATIGGAYSKIDNNLGKSTNNYLISGTYNFAPVVLKGSYGWSTETASGAQNGLSMWGLELDYPFDRNTTLFTYALKINNDPKAQGQFEALDVKYKPLPGNDPHIFGVGLRFDF